MKPAEEARLEYSTILNNAGNPERARSVHQSTGFASPCSAMHNILPIYCCIDKLEVWRYTVEALVRGHPREPKKVSVTGADRLRECKYAEFV